jgi:hypothetical protein
MSNDPEVAAQQAVEDDMEVPEADAQEQSTPVHDEPDLVEPPGAGRVIPEASDFDLVDQAHEVPLDEDDELR